MICFPKLLLLPAEAAAVATEKAIYVIPTRGIEQNFSIGGANPLQAVETLLAAEGTDHATINELLEKWATDASFADATGLRLPGQRNPVTGQGKGASALRDTIDLGRVYRLVWQTPGN